MTDPQLRTEITDHWTRTTDRVRNPEQTWLAWYAEVGEDTTTIWANFQGADPNAELAEINVRRSVFYPAAHHIDYITVRGFQLAQAACPWTPARRGRRAHPPREGAGSAAVIDVDLPGERKAPGQDHPAGPIATLSPGTSRISVW